MIDHKICPCCKIDKPAPDFYKDNSRNDGLQVYCISCEKIRNEGRRDKIIKNKKEYYQKNAELFKKDRREKTQSLKKEIISILGGMCSCCGLEYTGKNGAIFDCHHRDPKSKEFGIGSRQSADPEEIRQELEKCDLVCKNCHAMIHAEEY
jgi:predicted HNH restriction endonuclease